LSYLKPRSVIGFSISSEKDVNPLLLSLVRSNLISLIIHASSLVCSGFGFVLKMTRSCFALLMLLLRSSIALLTSGLTSDGSSSSLVPVLVIFASGFFSSGFVSVFPIGNSSSLPKDSAGVVGNSSSLTELLSTVFGSTSGVVVVSGLYTFSAASGSGRLSVQVFDHVAVVHCVSPLISAVSHIPEGYIVENTKYDAAANTIRPSTHEPIMIIFLFLSDSQFVEGAMTLVELSTEASMASRLIGSLELFAVSVVVLSTTVVSHVILDSSVGATSLTSVFLGLRNGSTNDCAAFVTTDHGSLDVASPRTILSHSKGSSTVAVFTFSVFAWSSVAVDSITEDVSVVWLISGVLCVDSTVVSTDCFISSEI
jgi:hypothetical protein